MALLASISFAAPLMLLGAAGVAGPIVAHLLTRRAKRTLVFPTIRFLHEAASHGVRVSSLRRWLLLALRCLAVLAIAMAFAQPLWLSRDTPRAAAAVNGQTSVVLVIDNSASLGRLKRGVSLATRAQSAARSVLTRLQPSDEASVIFTSPRPHAVLPELSRNTESLIAAVDGLAASDGRGSLLEAIALAGETLRGRPGAASVVVLSDLQQTTWADVLDHADAASLLPPNVTASVVALRHDDADTGNVALASPSFEPAALFAGKPFTLRVGVVNHSDAPVTARVTASVAARDAGVREVKLEPRSRSEAAFDVSIAQPGRFEAVFNIAQDDLPLDDRAYLPLRVDRHATIVLVTDDPPTRTGSASFFLTRALAPRGDDRDEMRVRVCTASTLNETMLADAQAVVMIDAGPLTPAGSQAVAAYVRAGGGLLYFCGRGAVKENMAEIAKALAADGSALWLPDRSVNNFDAPMRITRGAWTHPALQDLGPGAAAAVGVAGLRRVWVSDHPRQLGGDLLTLTDGTPALSLHAAGRGRVAIANFSPASDASDLGRRAIFVALTQSVTRHLWPTRPTRGRVTPGELVRMIATSESPARAGDSPTSGGMWEITGPDQARLADDPRLPRPDASGAWMRPERVGFYHLARAGVTADIVACNPDARESDLRAITPEQARSALARGGHAVGVHGDDTPINLHGLPAWHWFLLAAATALAVEMFLSPRRRGSA